MGCGDSKPIDVDLVGQPADKSAVFAGAKYVVPPGGPPLTLGWTGKAWDASKILTEIFDVRTGEVLFKAETESLGDTPSSDWAVTFSSANGAAVWQLVALSFGRWCTCLSSAVFECSGELTGINDTDVVLCIECDPKPTFTNIDGETATVTGASSMPWRCATDTKRSGSAATAERSPRAVRGSLPRSRCSRWNVQDSDWAGCTRAPGRTGCRTRRDPSPPDRNPVSRTEGAQTVKRLFGCSTSGWVSGEKRLTSCSQSRRRRYADGLTPVC